MSILSDIRTVLHDGKTAYADWTLIVERSNPESFVGSQAGPMGIAHDERAVMAFRNFEEFLQQWRLYLQEGGNRVRAQLRAINRGDGTVMAAVIINSPNEADVYHSELETEGFLHQRVAHLLKTWPKPFQAMQKDMKRFELRKDDRPLGFGYDDELRLAHWNPDIGIFMGDMIVARVTYICREEGWGLKPGHVVLGLVLQEYLPAANPKAQMWLGTNYPGNN